MKARDSITTVFAILVLLAYCLGVGSVFLPLIEYAMDYQRIIAEECENIEKPELQCNGGCYLSKQITRQAVPESKEPGTNIVILKLGIDPHFVTIADIPQLIIFSKSFEVSESNYTNIIIEKMGQPPEC